MYIYFQPYDLQVKIVESDEQTNNRLQLNCSVKSQLEQERDAYDYLYGRCHACVNINHTLRAWVANLEELNQRKEQRIEERTRQYQYLWRKYQQLIQDASGRARVDEECEPLVVWGEEQSLAPGEHQPLA